MEVQLNTDSAIIGPLVVEPLKVCWDRRQAVFPWSFTPEESSGEIKLPFGFVRLSIEPENQHSWLRVRLLLHIEQAVRLHQLELRYRFTGGKPDWAWIPHLRPSADQVIADQVFRSPAIIVEKSGLAAALIPDLSSLPSEHCTYLDFVRSGPNGRPILSHGIGRSKPTGHIFFKKVRAKKPTPSGIRINLAHYLLSIPSTCGSGLEAASSFLWRQNAAGKKEYFPQVLDFTRYEKLVNDRIFAHDLYQRFEIDGRPVAGMITQTVTAKRKPQVMNARQTEAYLDRQNELIKALRFIQAKIFTHPLGNKALAAVLHSGRIKIAPMASFGVWFNQARTALGAALSARRIEDAGLEEKASLIIKLALAAPVEDGCFPSICFFPEGNVYWKRGTKAFEIVDQFHLPDAAVTGFHLLEWQRLIAEDDRIVELCRGLADFFINVQDSSGAIPAWVKPGPDGLKIDPELAQSASTAASAMLLASLNRFAPDPGYLQAAKAALRFVEREVLPECKWFDYELFFSCAGRPTGKDGPDPYTGVYPANTLGMYWTARAGLDIWLASGDQEFLDLGLMALANLSMQQQVFDNPRHSINTFGGFGVMNADAEFNDARQGLFVPLYLDYYRATGQAELFERGVAALRASFTTMLVEEHRDVALGNLVRFRPSDRGAILENYGHTGRDEVTAGYLSPDWGCGTALYASGMAFRQYGQVYVDPDRKQAFGLDLCRTRFVSLSEGVVNLQIDTDQNQALEIVVENPDNRVTGLLVNDRPAKRIQNRKNRYLWSSHDD